MELAQKYGTNTDLVWYKCTRDIILM